MKLVKFKKHTSRVKLIGEILTKSTVYKLRRGTAHTDQLPKTHRRLTSNFTNENFPYSVAKGAPYRLSADCIRPPVIIVWCFCVRQIGRAI